ncbi:hypothetical protein AVEN_97994-1 [Araneus ventricosus]|uniref:Uncharacterized protein n=1 Tax=Araneus ventricosus TaxID=182803 RepID=A0A4Y2IWP2_ARAVE|nr:hypothetical protein AVEN_97994-1 [Araneus ventricosus]
MRTGQRTRLPGLDFLLHLWPSVDEPLGIFKIPPRSVGVCVSKSHNFVPSAHGVLMSKKPFLPQNCSVARFHPRGLAVFLAEIKVSENILSSFPPVDRMEMFLFLDTLKRVFTFIAKRKIDWHSRSILFMFQITVF